MAFRLEHDDRVHGGIERKPSARATASGWRPASHAPTWAEPEGRRVEQRPHRTVALPREQVSLRPPLLIIYSLFNKSCILDLRPGNSVIEQLVAAGFDVSMLDWGVPDERDAANQLEDYVDSYIPAAIDRVCEL